MKILSFDDVATAVPKYRKRFIWGIAPRQKQSWHIYNVFICSP